MSYQKEIKSIKLLQERSQGIFDAHKSIESDLEAIKRELDALGAAEIKQTPEYEKLREAYLEEMNTSSPLTVVSSDVVYAEAEKKYRGNISLGDILTEEDYSETLHRIDSHVRDFNQRYSLDDWDYAIAGGCGLFAAMLDWFYIKKPLKPGADFSQKVDGIFNQWVQNALNKLLPPELSAYLSGINKIGSPDTSMAYRLLGGKSPKINPTNHRLKSLAHDPVLGLFFGVWDMSHNTCTIVTNGRIQSFPGTQAVVNDNFFYKLGRMLGHLLSDVNAPTAKDKRGMGLPAPFMGLLHMLEGIPVGDSNFGKQIEWMYVNGYDFRQFVTTSVPLTIMEGLMRVFYVGKQINLYNTGFGETLMDTMPLRLNPRFRMMLAISYGTVSAINSGKVYITENILNINGAAWLGLVWNGFHSLKWALMDRSLKLWGDVMEKEITALENLVAKMEHLEARVGRLPH